MKHVIKNTGEEYWLNENSQCHRIDGPTIIYPEGSESWYKNGFIHRKNNPAFININGWEAWWNNGKHIK